MFKPRIRSCPCFPAHILHIVQAGHEPSNTVTTAPQHDPPCYPPMPLHAQNTCQKRPCTQTAAAHVPLLCGVSREQSWGCVAGGHAPPGRTHRHCHACTRACLNTRVATRTHTHTSASSPSPRPRSGPRGLLLIARGRKHVGAEGHDGGQLGQALRPQHAVVSQPHRSRAAHSAAGSQAEGAGQKYPGSRAVPPAADPAARCTRPCGHTQRRQMQIFLALETRNSKLSHSKIQIFLALAGSHMTRVRQLRSLH